MREFGKLRAATWPEAFLRVAQKMKAAKPERVGIILGDLVGAEEAFSVRQLAEQLGIKNIDCRQDGTPLGELGGRAGYLFNSGIAGIEEADAIMLIGSNPRLEAPVLNARIRKRYLKGGCIIGVIGEKADLTYPYTYLGAGPDTLAQFVEHAPAKAQKPMFIIGQGALARPDGAAVLANAYKAAHVAGRHQGRLERLQRAAHGGGPRRRARCLRAAGQGRRQDHQRDARAPPRPANSTC